MDTLTKVDEIPAAAAHKSIGDRVVAARVWLAGGVAAAAAAVITFIATAGPAAAAAYNPSTDLASLGDGSASSASPALVGMSTSLIPLLVIFLGIGLLFRLFGRRKPV